MSTMETHEIILLVLANLGGLVFLLWIFKGTQDRVDIFIMGRSYHQSRHRQKMTRTRTRLNQRIYE